MKVSPELLLRAILHALGLALLVVVIAAVLLALLIWWPLAQW